MSDFAQSVKQQADIVRVVGEYITLKKTGAQNYSGLCPFHGEKTPSFSVHVTRQFYHCFGCGVSGDVFKFVQEIDKVSFPEAVKIVAQKCGIALPKREFSSPEEAAESRLRGRLLELYEQATLWFEEQLKSPEGARAREYLTGRGLKPETIAKFRIGYAPDGFGGLRERLAGAAPPDVLRTSGLFRFKEQEDGAGNKNAGRIYDYFRKRITFPIANEGGRVIAFTARALDSDEPRKYMNSPETPLYSKGQVLFNLDKARQAIRQQNMALLVEGQMDCISVFAAGVTPVLATSGTAFTEHQARLLRRYTTRLVVNFDPDTAGANAAEKSIALLTEEGFEVRVVTLDGGLDPDRFVRERGIQAYAEALKGAVRHSDYLIERARKLFPVRTAQGKVEAVNFLLPHIRRMPHPIARDEFAQDAAQKLAIDSALLRQELKQAAAKRQGQVSAIKMSNLSECERVLVRALAGGWLMLAVWAALGMLLGVLTRGTSLAIGIGILYALVIEGLLSALADGVDALQPLTDVFLRANGYSLARALGASADSIGSNGPGSFGGPFVPAGQAVAVLAAFIAAFAGLSAWLLRRRDVV